MVTTLCTLFNCFYLDKALVLYDSLKESAKNFKLYILCMDDKCYDVLSDLAYSEIIPIKLSDFEDEEMKNARRNRSFGEYCWTCSSALILYVLETFKESVCTYIDADMYFYKDPSVLIEEMLNAGKKVMITPHRFTPDKERLQINGLYCVEFNTFTNDDCSLEVLREWKKDCLNCCTSVNDGIHFGDQKYLDVWPSKYPKVVHICQHPGAGVAPWNIGWYKGVNLAKKEVLFKKTQDNVPVIFYHFHNVTYNSRNVVKIGILKKENDVDYSLIDSIYTEYLKKIEYKKRMLETKYDIQYIMKQSPIKDAARLTPIKMLKRLLAKSISFAKNKRYYIIKVEC